MGVLHDEGERQGKGGKGEMFAPRLGLEGCEGYTDRDDTRMLCFDDRGEIMHDNEGK